MNNLKQVCLIIEKNEKIQDDLIYTLMERGSEDVKLIDWEEDFQELFTPEQRLLIFTGDYRTMFHESGLDERVKVYMRLGEVPTYCADIFYKSAAMSGLHVQNKGIFSRKMVSKGILSNPGYSLIGIKQLDDESFFKFVKLSATAIKECKKVFIGFGMKSTEEEMSGILRNYKNKMNADRQRELAMAAMKYLSLYFAGSMVEKNIVKEGMNINNIPLQCIDTVYGGLPGMHVNVSIMLLGDYGDSNLSLSQETANVQINRMLQNILNNVTIDRNTDKYEEDGYARELN